MRKSFFLCGGNQIPWKKKYRMRLSAYFEMVFLPVSFNLFAPCLHHISFLDINWTGLLDALKQENCGQNRGYFR